MNKALLALNILLVIAVAVLFYLHFGDKKKESPSRLAGKDTVSDNRPFRIAYFDMDSVESNFILAKEMQSELNRRDDEIANEMSRMQSNYQQRFQKFNQEGPAMNQQQVEAAQRELFQLEQNIKSRKMALDQNYQNYYVTKQQEILTMIKNFCADYNKDKRYSLIIANEPGLIYYKDTAFNITSDLLKGLNEIYKQKKSKK